MKRISLLSLVLVTTLALSACAPKEVPPEATPMATATPSASASAAPTDTPMVTPTPTPKGKNAKVTKQYVDIQTAKGTIELELYPDKAPGTVSNFLEKVKSGFYKGLTFHRVENWVIQGGDPLGNGTGGGEMPTELSDEPFIDGSLGVARGSEDIKVSNDSQFFICTSDCGWLTNKYTNFGKVTKGMDVAKKIEKGDKMINLTIVEK
ncbi:MAG: peptidylprolyl isomerase [Candidatus Woesebacteria bacterium]